MKRARKMFVAFCLLVVFSVATVSAMYYPDSFYDARAKTWAYEGPYTTSYNCLGYATGSMSFEWPWDGNVSTEDVSVYLQLFYGYKEIIPGSPYQAKILSYGTPNNVVHFAKGNRDDIIAKWGSLELISSETWNPYYSAPSGQTDYYGPLVATYREG